MKRGDFRLYRKPQPIAFTKEGYAALEKKYATLKAERPTAVEHLKKAREMGDLSENGYYKASRQRLSSLDAEIVRAGSLLKNAVIQNATSTETVMLGSTVVLETDGKKLTYMIVGKHEANPSDGKISVVSPLGKALVGKRVGDSVTVRDYSYTIFSISS